MSRRHLHAVVVSFAALVSLIVAASARAEYVSPAALGALLSPPAQADEITQASASPDGRWIAFSRAETRVGEAGKPWEYRWDCADNWVVRTDGSALQRLTTTCDYGSSAGQFNQSGTWWLGDGSLASRYISYTDHFGPRTTRWKLSGSPSAWSTSATHFGDFAGASSDGRYELIKHLDWGYMATSWSALDLATDRVHPIWNELHQGDGDWSADCAAAPDRDHKTPGYADVQAVLGGATPICAFARVVDGVGASGRKGAHAVSVTTETGRSTVVQRTFALSR